MPSIVSSLQKSFSVHISIVYAPTTAESFSLCCPRRKKRLYRTSECILDGARILLRLFFSPQNAQLLSNPSCFPGKSTFSLQESSKMLLSECLLKNAENSFFWGLLINIMGIQNWALLLINNNLISQSCVLLKHQVWKKRVWSSLSLPFCQFCNESSWHNAIRH